MYVVHPSCLLATSGTVRTSPDIILRNVTESKLTTFCTIIYKSCAASLNLNLIINRLSVSVPGELPVRDPLPYAIQRSCPTSLVASVPRPLTLIPLESRPVAGVVDRGSCRRAATSTRLCPLMTRTGNVPWWEEKVVVVIGLLIEIVTTRTMKMIRIQ